MAHEAESYAIGWLHEIGRTLLAGQERTVAKLRGGGVEVSVKYPLGEYTRLQMHLDALRRMVSEDAAAQDD